MRAVGELNPRGPEVPAARELDEAVSVGLSGGNGDVHRRPMARLGPAVLALTLNSREQPHTVLGARPSGWAGPEGR
jgi:hypothetical protein